MNAPAHGERVINVGARGLAPRLSVLTPFHRHDPSALIAALGPASAEDVELVLLDDGSSDAALVSRVMIAAERSAIPTRIVVRGANRGRAAARNRLIAEARGAHVLFLDADMIPDSPDFLARWLDLMARELPAVAFGGLSVRQAPQAPESALHRFLFARSDCRDVHARTRDPAYHLAASNLLVRCDVLEKVPFDDDFAGWGWEDVDWALRAARVAHIMHVDNPATHAGLDSVDTLLRKFTEAGANFARLTRKHPQALAGRPSHRAARLMQRAPARAALRRLCARVARFAPAPLPMRHAALKLYRASVYAEHLP